MLLNLQNEQASIDVAKRLATQLKPPLLLGFSGEIGAGKTTIIRAMLRASGVGSSIKSPTFSLVESYECKHAVIHHFDLYRIAQADELEYLGFRDYFTNDSICIVEWPENARQVLSEMDLYCKLRTKGAGRELELQAFTAAGNAMLSCLAGDS